MAISVENPMITTTERAKILGISHRAVRELASASLMPAYSLGDFSPRYSLRYDKDVVLAFFGAATAPVPSEAPDVG